MAVVVAITLAACGEEESSSGGGGDGQGGTKVAALGDSITAGAPLWDPDKATRDSLGEGVADEKSQYEYWAEQRLGDASFKNCGVSGQRTDEIAARFDECTKGAEVVIVQGGANDLNQGKSPESAAQNLQAMIKKGKDRGLRVATTELVPWPGGDPDQTPNVQKLNELIAQIGEEEDVPVFAWNEALADPGQPGQARPGMIGDDQIHPTVEGYKRIAEEVELP